MSLLFLFTTVITMLHLLSVLMQTRGVKSGFLMRWEKVVGEVNHHQEPECKAHTVATVKDTKLQILGHIRLEEGWHSCSAHWEADWQQSFNPNPLKCELQHTIYTQVYPFNASVGDLKMNSTLSSHSRILIRNGPQEMVILWIEGTTSHNNEWHRSLCAQILSDITGLPSQMASYSHNEPVQEGATWWDSGPNYGYSFICYRSVSFHQVIWLHKISKRHPEILMLLSHATWDTIWMQIHTMGLP